MTYFYFELQNGFKVSFHSPSKLALVFKHFEISDWSKDYK